jgi:hypothetical protein
MVDVPTYAEMGGVLCERAIAIYRAMNPPERWYLPSDRLGLSGAVERATAQLVGKRESSCADDASMCAGDDGPMPECDSELCRT